MSVTFKPNDVDYLLLKMADNLSVVQLTNIKTTCNVFYVKYCFARPELGTNCKVSGPLLF